MDSATYEYFRRQIGDFRCYTRELITHVTLNGRLAHVAAVEESARVWKAWCMEEPEAKACAWNHEDAVLGVLIEMAKRATARPQVEACCEQPASCESPRPVIDAAEKGGR